MHRRPRPPRPPARAARIRTRRFLAAALAALTVGGTAHLAVTRPDPEAVPAVVAVRHLPLGHVLSAGDVQVRALPAAAVPEGALTGADAVAGRTVAAPLARGEVLTGSDLHTSQLLVGTPPGSVAVFLPLAEPAVAGSTAAADVVDVHSPLDGAVVVSRALVLRADTGERPGLWLVVDPADAQALAAAQGRDPAGAALLVALHPAPRPGPRHSTARPRH